MTLVLSDSFSVLPSGTAILPENFAANGNFGHTFLLQSFVDGCSRSITREAGVNQVLQAQSNVILGRSCRIQRDVKLSLGTGNARQGLSTRSSYDAANLCFIIDLGIRSTSRYSECNRQSLAITAQNGGNVLDIVINGALIAAFILARLVEVERTSYVNNQQVEVCVVLGVTSSARNTTL